MKNILVLLVSIVTSANLFAQFTGKVAEIDANGDTLGLPGVSLIWENTNSGGVSDENGLFTIPFSKDTKSLVFSAVGYAPAKLVVKDTAKFVLVVLKPGLELSEIDIVYFSNGTEISYLSAIKLETLTERSLVKAACCNLSESFETNPSIDVSFSDAVSGAKQIQLLGLSGQYAQITKENMPYLRGLASPFGLTFIPGTWIQSIQLSKGAGSVINGYESFTGQINTELQNPANSDKVLANVYVNQNRRNEYNLNVRHKLSEKWSTGLLSHFSSNPILEDMNHDQFADIPSGRQINLMNKWSYQHPKSGFEAQFGAGYLDDARLGGQASSLIMHKHDSLPLYGISIENKKLDAYSKTGIVFKQKPGHSAGLQLSYLQHRQKNLFGSSVYSGDEQTLYANFIYQGIIRTTDRTFRIGSSFLLDNVDETWRNLHVKRSEHSTGIFGEFAYTASEKFNLVAGLRADYNNYYGLFATPRLHLRYAPRTGFVIRLSGGRALRTANVFADNAFAMASSREWIIAGTHTSLPFGLKPEIGYNYGLNVTKKFKFNYREAYFTADVYRTDFISQVVTDIDSNAQQIHIYNLNGRSFSNTFQFEVNIEPRKRLFLKSAYRYVDTKQTLHGILMEKPFVSKHRAFLNVSYETRDSRWLFDATLQYNGSKRLPSTHSNPVEYQRADRSPDFYNVLSQITYQQKIAGHLLSVYLGVENLLNYKQQQPIVAADTPYSKYFDAGMVWGPIYGRMVYAGLRYKIKE